MLHATFPVILLFVGLLVWALGDKLHSKVAEFGRICVLAAVIVITLILAHYPFHLP